MTATPGTHTGTAMARLLATVQAIVENSTAIEAKDFDSAACLAKWLERPQPSLGGSKPSDLIGTPEGADVVVRLLGSIESGAFQ